MLMRWSCVAPDGLHLILARRQPQVLPEKMQKPITTTVRKISRNMAWLLIIGIFPQRRKKLRALRTSPSLNLLESRRQIPA